MENPICFILSMPIEASCFNCQVSILNRAELRVNTVPALPFNDSVFPTVRGAAQTTGFTGMADFIRQNIVP